MWRSIVLYRRQRSLMWCRNNCILCHYWNVVARHVWLRKTNKLVLLNLKIKNCYDLENLKNPGGIKWAKSTKTCQRLWCCKYIIYRSFKVKPEKILNISDVVFTIFWNWRKERSFILLWNLSNTHPLDWIELAFERKW